LYQSQSLKLHQRDDAKNATDATNRTRYQSHEVSSGLGAELLSRQEAKNRQVKRFLALLGALAAERFKRLVAFFALVASSR
jgi:hypothetical protein